MAKPCVVGVVEKSPTAMATASDWGDIVGDDRCLSREEIEGVYMFCWVQSVTTSNGRCCGSTVTTRVAMV